VICHFGNDQGLNLEPFSQCLGKHKIMLFPIHIYKKDSIPIVIELILNQSMQIPSLSTLGTFKSYNVYQSADL
jgi:hypothetical protein